jgi:2-keto-4-pentenoate hydratase/2-oxohepta-3-ene-1,7-dioic acid hydratase in catechol pathway
MKLVRFSKDNEVYCGVLEGAAVKVLAGDFFCRPQAFTGECVPFDAVKVLPPVVPSKIIAVGLNYLDHIEEFKRSVPHEPCIFIKPPTSIIGHGDEIVLPRFSKRVDYEAELAIVIGAKCKQVGPSAAAGYVLGYTCLNDVTARDLQELDAQWARAKSFDTFCPVGPVVETVLNPDRLRIRALLNGKVTQDAHTSRMVFSCAAIVSFVSQVMTLLPGDIIATGTPGGGGTLHAGDTIEIDIEGIGRLTNRGRQER